MFSKTTEYALRAVIHVARNGTEEQKIGIDDIAKAIDAPRAFTAKILQLLRKDDRILCSVPGPHGGFYMTEKARRLPVRVVLELMDEDMVLKKCVLGMKKCSEDKPCPMHAEFKIIRQQLADLFTHKSLADLAVEKTKL
jgi:Rrf2 family protein